MNLTNLSPMGPRVLVKRLDESKMQSKYIEVIQHEITPSRFAIVLAVGTVDPDISVGDTVITKPYSGAPVEILFDGTPLEAYILAEDDVLAVSKEA